ncbi:hypothetical protein KUH32_16085 [Thalassococcus sp. CAU 1522]|uniref:PH domain-containing protein n=1 Tax=Thalassococcus arenae TaxID=2851652 RepID=A0ABS6NB87_9RHOB|nr:hypothetical protein [Thalassococcus arenae]MBV2361285.1 hypothetical protein [Thalassococcus arenae]
MSYRFERSGRRPVAAVALVAAWLALLALWRLADAAAWIVAIGLAITLPAAWDFIAARRAGLAIDAGRLTWWSGRHRGDAPLDKIDRVRLERRFDGSMRARLVLPGGRRITLPQDCLPPIAAFEGALDAAGLRHDRHPFSPF